MTDDPAHTPEVPEAEEKKPPLETDEEKAARAAIPALYIDTWFLSAWRGHLRITFGEEVGDLDMWRTAIIMETREAERLAQRILAMVARRRAAGKDGDRPAVAPELPLGE